MRPAPGNHVGEAFQSLADHDRPLELVRPPPPSPSKSPRHWSLIPPLLIPEMERHLALEAWALVMQHLPATDWRTCLSLSTTHHAIARRLVFSDIAISLEEWKDVDVQQVTYPLTHTIQDQVDRNAQKSFSLLQHIIATPDFADIIRKISVRAHGLGRNASAAFSIDILARALSKMRNLRAFSWYGTNPAPPQSIFNALFEASGRTLIHLSLPTDIPNGLQLPPHTQLYSFAVLHRNQPHIEWDPPVEPPLEPAQRILATNAHRLQRLCISVSIEEMPILYGCDPSAFTHLQELSLIYPRTIDGLEALFEHLTDLRSLTFCVDGYLGVDEAVGEQLRTHPGAFPRLHSLKLLHSKGYPRGTAPAQDVADFVLGHTATLRRLDVVLGPSALSFYGGCPLMWALPKMQVLEVLGFDWYPAFLVGGLVEFFHITFPHTLTAMHLFARPVKMEMTPQAWAQFFGARGGLRFVNVVCEAGAEAGLRGALFRDPPRDLALLGYNFGFHVVGRDPTTGRAAVEDARWSWPKAFHAAVPAHEDGVGGGDEVGRERDWEWLLRHHGHNDQINIGEWMLKKDEEDEEER